MSFTEQGQSMGMSHLIGPRDLMKAKLGQARECKPDYQKLVVKEKAKLEIITKFKDAYLEYLKICPHELKSTSFNVFELRGLLEFEADKTEDEIITYLELIEGERADGSK